MKNKFLINIFIFLILPLFLSGQNKKIVLVTDPWEPFYGPNLGNKGYISEITKEAFYNVGYDLEIKFVPWKRALEDSKEGKYDGVLGGFYNKERTKHFIYSDSISSSNMRFFARKGNNIEYNTLSDLINYKIGVIRGYSYSNEFDNSNFLQKEEINNIEQNIQKLIYGRIDVFLESEEVVFWLLKTKLSQYRNEIVPLGQVYITNDLYILISKKSEHPKKIIEDFNKGLEQIKKDGTFNIIMEKNSYIYTND
jgi:ABC-type amino acid transport substrate-binding protein